MIPADLSICTDCLQELTDPKNPRYQHPFISCMVCGPRYTVIDRIPYDRENTAMIDWPMCRFCESEYTDRTDRRYHAQTISCHECGPQMILRQRCGSGFSEMPEKADALEEMDTSARRTLNQSILARACELLQDDQVIAVKGVGGYHLMADLQKPGAVSLLREIKAREQKPFAVMFRDTAEIRKFCYVSEAEVRLLESSARPIILLEHRDISEISMRIAKSSRMKVSNDNMAEIEKSRFIGAFLPSTALQYLLLEQYGRPLIATSANLSNMPIIKDEDEMFALMEQSPLIAACLYNQREIRVRVDDSVVRVIDGQPQMIRRSKGYAPVPLFLSAGSEEESEKKETRHLKGNEAGIENQGKIDKTTMILAVGGQLKNSFALSKGQFSYISQYFGDLDSAENRKLYRENVERMAKLFRIVPHAVACDLHPLYATTQFAEEYAEHQKITACELSGASDSFPIFRVQHHHAHVASVMAEHHLDDAVIGVSMDGTGYGTDGNVWGGEFLVCRGSEFMRAAHLKYVQMIGGDGSMKEAWKSAMCYWIERESSATEFLKEPVQKEDAGSTASSASVTLDLSDIFAYAKRYATISKRSEFPVVRAALKAGINCIWSSSMGRLFDAVSALLGIQDYNDYEGQCAILLEDAAARAVKHPGASERDDLALRFHESIAQMIAGTCHKIREGTLLREMPEGTSGHFLSGRSVNQVALTGGVFQNKILMERTLELLREDGFEVYYNVSVSPNDGGIALGQNYVALCKLAGR